ncbi:hypothetical protein ACIGHN_09330 [Acidovorax sp. NPDC077693]|uniref:hypothetical protein n=1 Tax=unclassified Acidovorax TaxID=2684926 RepID=UPI0037C64A90
MSTNLIWLKNWRHTKNATISTLLFCIIFSANSAGTSKMPGNTVDASTSTDTGVISLKPLGIFGGKRESFDLVFSTTGERFAYRNHNELELWQTLPLKRLAHVDLQISSFIDQMIFDPTGKFHYIDQNRHHWITNDLQQGTGGNINLLSPNGRYAVRRGPRQSEDNFTPNYHGASSDIYDLQEKRSVCQFPSMGWLSNAAFTNNWFAVQLAFTGPQPPKPLAVCEIATGRALIMPFGDAKNLLPTLDPQGRWLMVHSRGTRFFGLSQWADRALFALPLAQNAFAKNPDDEPHPCAELPCGRPAPLPPVPGLPIMQPKISPDGDWLIYTDSQSVQIFQNQEMRQVAVLTHAPYQQLVKNVRTGKHVLVFSGNSRWIGLQVNSRLYRIDLKASPLRLQEVAPPINDFNLQAISSDGVHWLVQHETERDKTFQGALWGSVP